VNYSFKHFTKFSLSLLIFNGLNLKLVLTKIVALTIHTHANTHTQAKVKVNLISWNQQLIVLLLFLMCRSNHSQGEVSMRYSLIIAEPGEMSIKDMTDERGGGIKENKELLENQS